MFVDNALKTMFGSEKRSGLDSHLSMLSDVYSIFAGTPNAKASASNYRSSLKLSAVYNAVDQISSDVAKIPFTVSKKDLNNSSKSRQRQHPADILLSLEPNKFMTTYIWKKTMMTSLLLRGNALSIIESSGAGMPAQLTYINWDYVFDIKRNGDELLYYIMGYEKPFLQSEVIHIKNLTHNGVVGVSVITYAANQMNMAIEIQNFSATNFEQKGVRSGVIYTDKSLGSANVNANDVKKGIRQGWAAAMQERSADRVVVLDEGMKFKPINITPQEAQIVEMSRFTVEDIARWFNIPMHKLKSLEKTNNNTIEQQSLDYSNDCIYPYVVNFEQEFSRKLLTSKEKNTDFYVIGDMTVLIRADIKSKAEYYSKAINFGWMSRKEVRDLEEMNPGPQMLEEYLTPINAFTEEQMKSNLDQKKNG